MQPTLAATENRDAWGLENELVSLYRQLEIEQASDEPDALEILVDDIVSLYWQLDMTDQAIMMRWHLPEERVTDDFLRPKMLQDRVDSDIRPRQPQRWKGQEITLGQRLHLKHLAEERKTAVSDVTSDELEPEDDNGPETSSD